MTCIAGFLIFIASIFAIAVVGLLATLWMITKEETK